MKSIVEFLYSVVKNYVTKKAIDTGNQEFVDKCNNAFKTIEDIWEAINNAPKQK
jgi:hypothetical protein